MQRIPCPSYTANLDILKGDFCVTELTPEQEQKERTEKKIRQAKREGEVGYLVMGDGAANVM